MILKAVFTAFGIVEGMGAEDPRVLVRGVEDTAIGETEVAEEGFVTASFKMNISKGERLIILPEGKSEVDPPKLTTGTTTEFGIDKVGNA